MGTIRAMGVGGLLLLLSTLPVVKAEEVLSLPEAIQTALERSPEIALSEASVDIARASLRSARSGYWPDLTGSASQTHSESNLSSDLNGQEIEIRSETDRTSLGLNLTQNIWDFGRRGGSIRSAEEGLDSSELDGLQTVRSVVHSVVVAYYQWLQSIHVRDVRAEGLDLSRRHLESARIRLEVGRASPLEVSKARSDAASSEVDLLVAGNLVAQRRIELLRLLGVGGDRAVIPQEVADPPPVRLTLEETLEMAVLERPDLASAAADVRAQEARLRQSRAAYLPRLTANGSYTWSGDEFPLDDSWSASVGLSSTLFDGFGTPAAVESARASLRSARAMEERLRLATRADVTKTYLAMEEARQRRRAAEVSLEAAREALDLATGRFEEGLTSELGLEDSRHDYLRARDALYQARTDLRVSVANLMLSIGAPMPDALQIEGVESDVQN